MTIKTAPAAPARPAAGWRRRLPVLVVVAAMVASVVAAVAGAANAVDKVRFLPSGHWVYNAVLGQVLHIDGATARVDARGRVPGEYGSDVQVVQGDTSGYVVGNSRITEFGKSDLEVVSGTGTPGGEVPVAVRTTGGPYLVYRGIGRVVRLGEDAGGMPVGGPVGDPVATSDGTVWLPRVEAGLLCKLTPDADSVSCPVALPKGDHGVLAVVDDRPVFLDTATDLLHPVEGDGLGAGRELGVDASSSISVASGDVAGRVVILEPGPGGAAIHLVDPAGMDPGRAAAEPLRIPLGDGDYAPPVSSGDAIVVMERDTHTVTTYDRNGVEVDQKTLPDADGKPRVSRGEDGRVYVDGAEGEHVLVVDHGGRVTDVPTGGEGPAGGEPETTPPAADPPATDPPAADPPVGEQQTPQPPRTEIPAGDQTPDRGPTPDQGRPVTPRPPPPVTPPPLPASPPGAPPAVSAQAGDASATVTWGEAADNRAPITRYTVSWNGSNGVRGSVVVGGGARQAAVAGLANGVGYVFTVAATNSAGTGPGAASASVVPLAPVTPAGAPGGVAVDHDPAAGTAVVRFTPPALNGGTLQHYQVSATGLGERTFASSPAAWTGVATPTAPITFTVRAVTRAPDGRTLDGAPASATLEPPPPPTVHLTRGERTEETEKYCGTWDSCTWMHLEISGLTAGESYFLMPDSTDTDYSNPGHRFTADGPTHTTDKFAYSGVGENVWVEMTLPDGRVVRSNTITWEPR
ncbi:fibronectin type III domain-containing protein [Actinokineospora sp. G85]|uniref:fibronectin type III domain-containing protein n=1 Tax=Actinokineospora sp. G85 TaxID=3406626 RepID=UPI003C7357AD